MLALLTSVAQHLRDFCLTAFLLCIVPLSTVAKGVLFFLRMASGRGWRRMFAQDCLLRCNVSDHQRPALQFCAVGRQGS
eukprot:12906508-Alexandrium_andersonii.AAC.1